MREAEQVSDKEPIIGQIEQNKHQLKEVIGRPTESKTRVSEVRRFTPHQGRPDSGKTSLGREAHEEDWMY